MSANHPKSSYRAQIRSPQWIQKATDIKAAAGWKCELCKKAQGDVELSIHHTYYVHGLMMWQHPPCLLMCLCDSCHVERQALEQKVYVNVADVMRNKSNEEIRNQPIFTFFE